MKKQAISNAKKKLFEEVEKVQKENKAVANFVNLKIYIKN